MPRASAWAHRGSAGNANNHSPSTSVSRQTRRGGLRQLRNSPALVQATPSDYRASSTRTHQDRKTAGIAMNSSSASLSRPSTPVSALLPQRPATPADVKALRLKKASYPPQPSRSPAPSVGAESDQGSGSHDVPPSSLKPDISSFADNLEISAVGMSRLTMPWRGHFYSTWNIQMSYTHFFVPSWLTGSALSYSALRTCSYSTLVDALSGFKTSLSLLQSPQEWLDASRNHVLNSVAEVGCFSVADRSDCLKLLDQTQMHLVCFRLLIS